MNDKTLLKKLDQLCKRIEEIQRVHQREMDALYERTADIYEAIYKSQAIYKSHEKKKAIALPQ